MVIFRSTDSGKTWRQDSIVPRVAETGFLHLGGRRMLAAFRNESGKHDSKTVQLANSEDRGRTWHSHRPLTRMYGQAHGDLVALPGGGVVATFENRYPYADGGAMLARVSWDGGQNLGTRALQAHPGPRLLRLGGAEGRHHNHSGRRRPTQPRRPPHRSSLHPAGSPVETLAEGEEGWGVARLLPAFQYLHPSHSGGRTP